MQERLVYLSDAESIPDSGVFIKNIDIVDPISAIDITVSATTGGTSCINHEIHDDISKIEVLDGGDVLHSLSMIEEQALNCFERGQFPWFDFNEGASKVVRESCHIMFGRTYRDEEINLVPTAFKNPQLRITHALTISATEGFATNTGAITAIAHVLEDVSAAHKGFFLTKEHYSYNTTASGHEYVDLPVDYTYRLIMLKALLSTHSFVDLVDNVKLHADREKFVKMNISGGDLVRHNFSTFPLFSQAKTLLASDGDTRNLDIYNIRNAAINIQQDLDVGQIEALAGEQLTMQVLALSTTPTIAKDTTDRAILATVEGMEPHGCVCLPMGDLQQPEDWWDVSKYGSIKLDILATGTGDAAAAVVIQQLRP